MLEYVVFTCDAKFKIRQAYCVCFKCGLASAIKFIGVIGAKLNICLPRYAKRAASRSPTSRFPVLAAVADIRRPRLYRRVSREAEENYPSA